MLNPALYLVVFYVVFQLILEPASRTSPIFLLSRPARVEPLLAPRSAAATGSIVGNAGAREEGVRSRARSCRSPRSAPRWCTSSCRASCSSARWSCSATTSTWAYLPLLPPALIALAAAHRRRSACCSRRSTCTLRDTQHLLELALLAWFWMTPIVYPYRAGRDKLGSSTGRGCYAAEPGHRRSSSRSSARSTRQSRPLRRRPRRCTQHPPGPVVSWWYLRQPRHRRRRRRSCCCSSRCRIFGRLEGNFAEEL